MKPKPRIVLTLVAVAVVGASACGDVLGIAPPSSARRMEPVPAEYFGWWELTQQCSGLRGSFESIEWLVVPDDATLVRNRDAEGAWYLIGNQIALKSSYVHTGGAVRHEMLHALLRQPGHPKAFFAQACAAVVACGRDCIEDAGDGPDRNPNAVVVSAEILDVQVLIVPDTISLSKPPHCFTVAVTARNTQNRPVRARLVAVSGIRSSQSFGWSVPGLGGAGVQMTDSLFAFAPLEKRGQTFDCVTVLPSWRGSGLAPGIHTVTGYLRGTQRSQELVIVP